MSLEGQFIHHSWYDKLPPVTDEVCEENLSEFFRTMFERQEIWNNRFMLEMPRPWSKDKYLANFKFTNVYRELDRSSQWLVKNVLLNTDLMRKDLVWQIILYRIFNNPETFEAVKLPTYDEYNQEAFAKEIDAYHAAGNNPFTTAYMVNATYCKGEKRHNCYTAKMIPVLHKMVPVIMAKIKQAEAKNDPYILIDQLTKLPMVATFLAHEFYQDFTYTTKYSHIQLTRFTQDDYTNVGPGASLGIRLIYPSCSSKKAQLEKIHHLRDIALTELKKFGKFKHLAWNPEDKTYSTVNRGSITLHQIEMWLCEFQKYWKMTLGEGKQRQSFKLITKTL